VSKTIQKATAAGLCLRVKSPVAQDKFWSKLAHQITATNAKSLGNSQEGIHRNGAMPVFQKGKENDRQAGFFSQFFLGHFQPFAMGANGVSQDAAVCWNRRHAQYKQAEPENNIYYSIILILRDFGKDIKMCGNSEK
jgi:hypothetical protein